MMPNPRSLFLIVLLCSIRAFGQMPVSSGSPAASPSQSPHRHAPHFDASASPAPGGGPGLVWVNLNSHVYHKLGSRYYGKTRHGKYLPEADAIKEGDHAAKDSQ